MLFVVIEFKSLFLYKEDKNWPTDVHTQLDEMVTGKIVTANEV